MKRILVTGANGLLGQKVVDLLVEHPGYTALFCGRGKSRLNPEYQVEYQELDITNAEETLHVVKQFSPDAIINCAAYTHVDNCERHPEDCHKGNVGAVKNLITAIGDKPIHLVHISTDFVFDGEKSTPYFEDDLINPLSEYGRSKARSEKILQESSVKFTILRTVFVYGVLFDNSRANFVTWAKESLENKKEITVISDQFRPPTFAEDLAQACILSIEKEKEGIFHISGPETQSILHWIECIADFWNLDKEYILPTKTEELNQLAVRPKSTNLSIKKAQNELNYKPHTFVESLKIINKQLT
jgi:dTDP-4-dehydrorhamnose reductase